MSKGIIAGVVFVIVGIMLIVIGGSFFTQSSSLNQTVGPSPTTQVTNGFGVAFVAGGILALICGVLICIMSLRGSGGSFRGG
jgi:drug/metabolite transporter (DMT)-like permease